MNGSKGWHEGVESIEKEKKNGRKKYVAKKRRENKHGLMEGKKTNLIRLNRVAAIGKGRIKEDGDGVSADYRQFHVRWLVGNRVSSQSKAQGSKEERNGPNQELKIGHVPSACTT